ncbi:MAG: hypothetical protein M3O71_28650 [Bacteroidota bacterium]|nr:hypothetical protein [Bacteroidota bacterium]
MPAITQSIVDNGTVLVYLRNTGSSTGWFAIPYAEAGHTIDFNDYGVGYIDLKANFTQAAGIDFRVVVIPGTSVTVLNATNPNLNIRNFSEVAKALHLSN